MSEAVTTAGGAPPAERRRRLLAALAIGAVLALALAPSLTMLLESVRGEDGLSLAAYTGLLEHARTRQLLWRSVLVAAIATALSLIWGSALGLLVARLRGTRAIVVEAIGCLPLLLPSIVIVMAWIFLLGRAGSVTRWLEGTLGLARPPIDLYTPVGVGFVLSLCYFPCVSLLVAQGLRVTGGPMATAARLQLGPLRRAWTLWRPLLAPYVATGAVLVFLLSFADFGVPSALMVNVYPNETFAQLSAFLDPGRALASTAPPVAVALTVFLLRLLLVRGVPHAHAGGAPRPERGGVPPSILAAGGAVLLLTVVVPIVPLVLTAGGLSSYALALRTAGAQVVVSLKVAAIGVALLLGAALVFAAAYRALGARGRRLATIAALVPLVIPGAAVGLGILTLVARGVWPLSWLYPGASVVAYAGAARFLAFPALVLAAAFASLDGRLLRAAELAGAGPLRVWGWVALPLLWPALVAAATLSFLLCLGELSASVLVNPPGMMTLPVRIESLLHFGQDSTVAALCVILVVVVLAVFTIGALLAERLVRVRLHHAA